MTYNIGRETDAKKARAIQLSLSSDQTASAGDTVLFDTITASHSDHGVSLSSGVITLDPTRAYWLQASIDVTRSSATSSIKMSFYSGSSPLSSADGAGFAQWQWFDSNGPLYGRPNATFTAVYVSCSAHATSLNLRADVLNASSTLNAAGTKLFIIETEMP